MRKVVVFILLVVSVACSAAKYTSQMYAPATDANAVTGVKESANTEYTDTNGNQLTLKYFVVSYFFSVFL